MNSFKKIISFSWISALRETRKKRKARKNTEYYEKRWEMKLRGLLK